MTDADQPVPPLGSAPAWSRTGSALLVAERRADDPAPDDPFRGLYLSDETVDRLLDGRPDPPGPRRRLTTRHERPGRLEADADRRRPRERRTPSPPAGPRRRADRPRRRAAGHRPAARPRPSLRAPVRLPQRRRHPAPGVGRAGPAAGRRSRPSGRGAGAAGAERPLVGVRAAAGRGHRPPVPHPGPPGARPGGGAPARRRRTRPAGRAADRPVAAWPNPLAGPLAGRWRAGVTLVYLHERVAGTGSAVAVSALAQAGHGRRSPSTCAGCAGGHDAAALVALTVREALLARRRPRRRAGRRHWPM